MTCICKNDDWKCCKRIDCAGPLEDTHSASIGQRVSFEEVRYDKNNKICNREESNDAGVLQRVKTAQE
jgi:hypothetical protein